VSTRKLILTAFIAGLAILLAGGIQLLRITNGEHQATVHAVGDTAVVDGVSVTLTTFAANRGDVRLTVPAGAQPLNSIAAHFSMQHGVDPFPVDAGLGSANDCQGKTALPGQSLDCSLAFAAPLTGARYLRFTVNNRAAVWALP
jgi:hypothetical protein